MDGYAIFVDATTINLLIMSFFVHLPGAMKRIAMSPSDGRDLFFLTILNRTLCLL